MLRVRTSDWGPLLVIRDLSWFWIREMEPRHTFLKKCGAVSSSHRTGGFRIQGISKSKINILNSLGDFTLGDWLVIYMIPFAAAVQAEHHE